MNTSADIFRQIGVMLIGIPLAIAGDFCVRFVWPEMALPVFLCVIAWWMLPGTSFFRHREFVEKGWMSLQDARKENRFWPNAYESNRMARWAEYICNNIASTLIGFVVAVLLAGSIGLFLPVRFYVFVAVIAFWYLGVLRLILKDYRNSKSGGAVGSD